MEQTLTLVCKLRTTLEQVPKIEALLKAFADGCNYANQTVKPTITSKLTIQNQVYQDLRAYYGLSANQAVRACARVGANRKAAKQTGKEVKEFRPTSADYDARIFAFREKDWTVSLTLLGCREHIKLQLGNYQLGKLKGRKPSAAQLCKHRDGLYYIHIQLTEVVPEPIQSDKVIGVDFGRRDIAVTSKGDRWDGQQIKDVRDRFAHVRGSVQSKGTKGAKRLLKRRQYSGGIIPPEFAALSGRERRYQQWLNHNISRRIIDAAKQSSAVVAIEDLSGIRTRTNQQPRRKPERRRSNSWAFYQLRLFLEYKGLQAGVRVIAIPPAYTSQTCHQCLHIGLRSDKRFRCGNCFWHGDADFNASCVISLWGSSVIRPKRSTLFCSLGNCNVSAKAHSL